MLTSQEALSILADIATANGLLSGVDPKGLDPLDFPPGEQRHIIRRVLAGESFRDRILPDVSPELAALLVDHDPDTPPHQHSSWADLAAVLGPVHWEWSNWLPAAMLTMVVAEQAAGKSILALRIAACYLRGDPWPDGTPFTGETGAVLWCEAESSQGMNADRATAWGLPMERILSPLPDPLDDVLLQDEEHLESIRYMAAQPHVRLVVFDSLSGGNTAKENDPRMLHVVKFLATLAKQTGKPAILTHHLRKRGLFDGGDKITLDRIRGSGAIVQPSRVVWAIDTPDPQHEERRRLSIIKNNLRGIHCEPLGMVINDKGVTFGDAPEPPRTETQQDKAADILKALLRKGPRRSTELQDEIEAAGVSWDAAKRAKARMGIVAKRKHNVWWWGLGADGEEEGE